MKYSIIVDENKYLVSCSHTNTDKDIYEIENLEKEYINCYKLVDDILVLDEEKKALIIAEEEARETHEKNINAQTRNLAEMFVDMGIDADTFLSRIDAQVLYSALMTDTLLEDEDVA